MKYFQVREDRSAGYTGFVDAAHKWMLPGILRCPGCHATWSGGAKAYPSVNLSSLPAASDLEQPRAVPVDEYEQLSERVRPFLPRGARLEPGAAFGPLVGRATGRFGPFVANYPFLILARREAVEILQAAHLRGLNPCRLEVSFSDPVPPELLELELLPWGRAHPDCLPPDRKPSCSRCHRQGLKSPSALILWAQTLPEALDLFRLDDLPTVVVCTERFVDVCQRAGLDGLTFTALATR